jgi:hypothetical protein
MSHWPGSYVVGLRVGELTTQLALFPFNHFSLPSLPLSTAFYSIHSFLNLFGNTFDSILANYDI